MIEKTAEPGWMRRFEVALLVGTTGLFFYALAELLAPNSTAYQPLRMVFLSAALVLQTAASLVRERHRWLFYALLAASMLLLVLAIRA